MDPSQAIEDIERSIGLVPAALLAIVLLTAPTVAWLLYRFVVQPRTSRYAGQSLDLLWVCEDCRSANDLKAKRCYACGLDRDEMAGAVQVVDDDEVVTLPGEPEPIPVMGIAVTEVPLVAEDDRPLVAVGPGPAPIETAAGDGGDDPALEPDLAPEPVVVRVTPPRRHAAAGARTRAREIEPAEE